MKYWYCILLLAGTIGAAGETLPLLPEFSPETVEVEAAPTALRGSGAKRIVTVEVPALPGGGKITFNPKPFRGKRMNFSISARAENVSSPEQAWNGLKFMLVVTDSAGKVHYFGSSTCGTHDWKRLFFHAQIPPGAESAFLSFGMQGSTGKGEFALETLRVSSPESAGNVGRQVDSAAAFRYANGMLLAVSPKAIRAKPTPGNYRLLLKVKSANRGMLQRDTLFGGYNYFFPEQSYRLFTGNGKEIPLAISPRMAEFIRKDDAGNELYTGFLFSQQVVAVKEDFSLFASCSQPEGVIFELYFLSPEEWEAEKLRASALFGELKDNSFVGYSAWFFTAGVPRVQYPVASLEKFLRLMDFSETARLDGFDGAAFARRGAELLKERESFLALNDSAAANGAAVAARWNALRDDARRDIVVAVKKFIEEERDFAVLLRKQLASSCYAGRMAVFHLDVAERYLDELAAVPSESVRNDDASFQEPLHLLNSVFHARKHREIAQRYAAVPQKTVEYPGFFLAPAKRAAAGGDFNGYESLLLNSIWKFAPVPPDTPSDQIDKLPDEWHEQAIPYTSLPTFYNPSGKSDEEIAGFWYAYFDERKYRHCFFQRAFTVPERWNGGRIELHFEDVALSGAIYINGRYAGTHFGGMVPFSLDVTGFIQSGEENHLLVLVTSESVIADANLKRFLFPRPVGPIPGLRIGGDITLTASPQLRAEEPYIRTAVSDGRIEIHGELANSSPRDEEVTVSCHIVGDGREYASTPPRKVALKAGSSFAFSDTVPLGDLKFWGPGGEFGAPHNRYLLKTVLKRDNGKESVRYTPFAVRELKTAGRDFLLNGKKFPLQGSSSFCGEHTTMFAHNNIFFQYYENAALRYGNMNFLRFHRFNLQPWLIAACDDAGIVSEAEAPWWGLFTPPDFEGELDIDDPAWLKNCRDYYRGVARRYRNSPSMLCFALDNETLNYRNNRVFRIFRQCVAEEAPHLLALNHSIGSMDNDDTPVSIVHDYGVGHDRIRSFARNAKKPLIVGEYWNIDLFMANSNPEQAAGALVQSADYIRRSIRKYFDDGASGVMPFGFYISGALGSLGKGSAQFGPWGDLLTESPRRTFSVPVVWPAYAGNGGYRVNKMIFPNTREGNGEGAIRHNYINFWDDARPAMTPTAILDGFRDGFAPVPGQEPTVSAQVLIEAVNGGEALPNAIVTLYPAAGTVWGSILDPQGRTLLMVPPLGETTVEARWRGRTIRAEWNAQRRPLPKAGWRHLDRIRFDFSTGRAEVTPGSHIPLVFPPKETRSGKASPAVPEKEERRNSVFAFGKPIREWLLLGPFPNPGGRPDCRGFAQDFLGGEAAVQAREGKAVETVFPESDHALWSAGKVLNRWFRYVSAEDDVDLGSALVRKDIPGLSVAPLSYVAGYAATRIEIEGPLSCTLKVRTYGGVKVYVNGKLVLASHEHSWSADPASPVLPPTAVQEFARQIELRAGNNDILVKTDVDYGKMIFRLTLDRKK